MRPSLLTVHAHPDDESSKGAGTVRRYADAGARTTLVCCTGGEAGDILNPEMDTPEVVNDLARVRRDELAEACEVIGYDTVDMLGYLDSGMPDSEPNAHPDNFHNAPMDEAVDRLVAIIRRVRAQVIVTYSDDQSGYPHPDHLKVHDISGPAFDLAGDPTHRPDLGEPFEPSKLYYSVWSRARMVATHQAFLDLELESPFSDEWFERPDQDHRITTRIEVDNDIRRRALLCHRTQVDPTSPFWFGLPDDVQRTIHPYDEYILARSRVTTSLPEDDLFAGIETDALRMAS